MRSNLPRPILILSALVLSSLPIPAFGQGPAARSGGTTGSRPYPAGLSAVQTVGAFAIRDEHISGRRYTGTLPATELAWGRDHGRYVYRVGIGLGYSEDVRDRSVSSSITRLDLGQAFLYPLPSRTFLGRDLALWLGPATGVSLLVNEQHIAVDALGFSTSAVGLLYLGLRSDALLPVSSRLDVHGSLRLSLLSLGFRGVDDEIDDASVVKPLTPLTGLDASFELGARHAVTKRLSLQLAYRFKVLRVTAWNPVVAASDELLGGLTWRF